MEVFIPPIVDLRSVVLPSPLKCEPVWTRKIRKTRRDVSKRCTAYERSLFSGATDHNPISLSEEITQNRLTTSKTHQRTVLLMYSTQMHAESACGEVVYRISVVLSKATMSRVCRLSVASSYHLGVVMAGFLGRYQDFRGPGRSLTRTNSEASHVLGTGTSIAASPAESQTTPLDTGPKGVQFPKTRPSSELVRSVHLQFCCCHCISRKWLLLDHTSTNI